MRCALVNNDSLVVENVIIANPAGDQAPAGYMLVSLPDESPVFIGWTFNPATGVFSPPVE